MSMRPAFLAGIAVVFLAVLPGCGGGGDGGRDGGASASKSFIVRAVVPRDGQGSVPNDQSVTVSFSAPVDPLTVGDQTFPVTRADDPVNPLPGLYTVSTDGYDVTFEPDPWFETSTTYEVRVTQGLAAASGGLLVREFRASFSTGPWASPVPVEQSQFRVVTARMNQGRSSHTQTTLDNGLVLLTGGYGSATVVHATAEVFDPDREDFIPTMEAMHAARASHQATLLQRGLVLITGGERPGDYRAQTSAELFSPATLEFVDAAPMSAERALHTSTLLPDGRVLVTGGRTFDAQGYTVWHRSAEIYDPAADSWSPTDNDMEMLRAGHRATLLESGEVLVTGGSGERTAEIFDPDTNRFRTLAARTIEARYMHGAVRLENGIVLLTDGGARTGGLFDPDTETFMATGNKSNATRHAAVAFEYRPDEVLIIGGVDFDIGFIDGSMEQYDHGYGPGGRYFYVSPLPEHGVYLEDPRAFAAASKLDDGRFLLTGGVGDENDVNDLNTAILFDPRGN